MIFMRNTTNKARTAETKGEVSLLILYKLQTNLNVIIEVTS